MAATETTRRTSVKKYLPDVNKNYVWGAALFVAGLIGIYYWGKNNGSVLPAPLPNDTLPKTDPVTGEKINALTEAESKLIVRLANEFESQRGYIINPSYELLNEILGTSDRVFVGTYNYYNQLYASPPDTLKTIINSYSNYKIWFSEINHQYDAIVARMDNLGLK